MRPSSIPCTALLVNDARPRGPGRRARWAECLQGFLRGPIGEREERRVEHGRIDEIRRLAAEAMNSGTAPCEVDVDQRAAFELLS